MVFHEFLSLETTFPGVIHVYLWHLGGFCCLFVWCRGNWFCVIRDGVGCALSWSSWCMSWLELYVALWVQNQRWRRGHFFICFWVFNLRGCATCGGADILKISVRWFRGAVCLSPNIVSGLVGVGLRRVWVRSASACVAASFDDIISNVRDTGKTMWYPRLSI